ncbi:hypothetical protein BUALT_Bualt08G0046500 [Buddleja alternifolia]|uniref:hAT-like transposase RNase-H fold domain-containing protein n=1 Tax=Buddleja alternifolia TaxID=168488 RepID=A0AAV6XAW4_9LAMI|nr:hypothetical protein BUALT_Bualt08G0046500 [Buddleja alternifolia]
MSTNIPDSTNPIMHNLEETHMEANEEIDANTSQKVCGDGACDDIEQRADQENNVEFQKPKRQKTSKVWLEFKEVKDDDGTKKIQCIHCRGLFVKLKTTPTTQFHRHLKSCGPYLRAKFTKDKENLTQTQLAFVTKNVDPTSYSAFTDGKFDMEKMKEFAAQWILIDEHPFSIIEEDGLNFMLKRGMPDWRGFSRVTAKKYCVEVYEKEKKMLKNFLKNVNKVSLTTDLWKSKNQRIEYMVITGHWIDENWVLQKRVLNFVHLPPPRRGIEIANTLWECLAEWGIQSKVYSVSVDNASVNDTAIANLRIFVRYVNKLLCGGALFHVRCCAHILNLIAQNGLDEIRDIIDIVRDSVEYVRRSDARLKIFTEIVKQLNIPERKLIDDCQTRWNSTYEMLATAIKYKDVFPRFADRDQHYRMCPTDEDWEKVEKVISVLEVFWITTHIISGSDYPTSNLFLNEVSRVKELLDKKSLETDDFIQNMVVEMKKKFDKYWGECNLLMSIAAVLDPRCKMRTLEFCFPKLYSPQQVAGEISKVRTTLYALYSEYIDLYNGEVQSSGNTQLTSLPSQNTNSTKITKCGWSEFAEYVRSVETTQPQKSELDMYLKENCYICRHLCDGSAFVGAREIFILKIFLIVSLSVVID